MNNKRGRVYPRDPIRVTVGHTYAGLCNSWIYKLCWSSIVMLRKSARYVIPDCEHKRTGTEIFSISFLIKGQAFSCNANKWRSR